MPKENIGELLKKLEVILFGSNTELEVPFPEVSTPFPDGHEELGEIAVNGSRQENDRKARLFIDPNNDQSGFVTPSGFVIPVRRIRI